jgi:hypothetical protein
MANMYDPLSFPIREELEGGGGGHKYMPVEIARRTLRSGPRLPLPGGAVESLWYGIDGWYRYTAMYNEAQYIERVSW